MLTYSETLDYLFALHRFGVKLGLEAITELLQRLDHPQRSYATLHIGGTNGKGSSAAMVAAMLQAGGYRVGLYTSPHLIDFRERIQVQGEDISESHVCALTAHICRAADPLGTLTFFELTTAMAFLYFQEQRVDLAVIEVGLGGRYDATNVLDPLGVLITGIGFDHERYLGQTLEAIAGEKAGIIHQHAPVVLGQMENQVSRVFEAVAQAHQVPLYRFGQEFSVSEIEQTPCIYRGLGESSFPIHTNLLGRHQMQNAGCAVALLEAATAKQFPLPVEAMQAGLQHVRVKGRLQIIQHEPLVVVDGAHNVLGAQVLFDFLQLQLHDWAGRKLILLLGMMQDKNHDEYVRVLLPLVDTLIITQPQMDRAATVEELQKVVREAAGNCHAITNSWDAYSHALTVARPSDLICVTGSLFLVGEILQHVTPPSSSMVRNEQ